MSKYFTVQVFLPNKLNKLNKKAKLTAKVNYSTRARVADSPTLQSKNVLHTYTAVYFTHTENI